MRLKINGGYIDVELTDNIYKDISNKLSEIAKKEEEAKRKINSIENFKDVEKIGDREGDPNVIN